MGLDENFPGLGYTHYSSSVHILGSEFGWLVSSKGESFPSPNLNQAFLLIKFNSGNI
jgi:hypothetical protein